MPRRKSSRGPRDFRKGYRREGEEDATEQPQKKTQLFESVASPSAAASVPTAYAREGKTTDQPQKKTRLALSLSAAKAKSSAAKDNDNKNFPLAEFSRVESVAHWIAMRTPLLVPAIPFYHCSNPQSNHCSNPQSNAVFFPCSFRRVLVIIILFPSFFFNKSVYLVIIVSVRVSIFFTQCVIFDPTITLGAGWKS